jgi:hypothetical protein
VFAAALTVVAFIGTAATADMPARLIAVAATAVNMIIVIIRIVLSPPFGARVN